MWRKKWKPGGWVLLFLSVVLLTSACRPETVTEFVEVTREVEVVEEVPVTREVEVTRIVPAEPVDRLIDEIVDGGSGGSQRGSVDEAGELTGWSFQGEEGTRYGFEVRTVSGELQPVATVYDTDDHFIAVSQPLTGRDVLVLAEMPVDGDYVLVVTGLGGTTGIYEVEHQTADAETGSITYEAGVADILIQGETRAWTLEGKAGEVVNFQLHSDDFGGQLTIEDPAGNVLNEDTGGDGLFGEFMGGLNDLFTGMMTGGEGGNENVFLLREDGTYVINVSGEENGDAGRYELAVDREETIDPDQLGGGPLEAGETSQGYLVSGDVDEWTFAGQAGQLVSIAVRGSLDSVLYVVNPAGELIATDDDSGVGMNARLAQLPLVEDGDYTVSVTVSPMGEGGLYSLDLDVVGEIDLSNMDGGALEYDQVVYGYLMGANGVPWTFTGTAGDMVTIVMSSDTLDSYLILFGPDGAFLVEDDDSGGAFDAMIAHFSLPVTGEYTIQARTYCVSNCDAVAGTYELGLFLIP